LKHTSLMEIFSAIARFEPTYKELKLVIMEL